MATPPRIPAADTPLGENDEHIILQGGKRRRATNKQVVAAAATVKGDAGPQGKSAYEVAKAAGYPGTEAQWLASLKGDPGAPGAPLRVETYTATTNAQGVATFTFSAAFTTAPTVLVRSGWTADQYVGGGVTSTTLTGCTVLVKRSRGTLLLTTGPFETAPSGVSVSVVAFGR